MPATVTKTPPAKERFPGVAAWLRAARDLPDLPYKVESNARGQLILSPPSPEHGFSQFDVGRSIDIDTPGRVATEFSVYTAGGVKIPDVIWISDERRAEIPEGAAASPVMTEICVEVMSETNTEAEMQKKRRLYFEGGAEEVWIVGQGGDVRFFEADGLVEQSALAPDFPQAIQA